MSYQLSLNDLPDENYQLKADDLPTESPINKDNFMGGTGPYGFNLSNPNAPKATALGALSGLSSMAETGGKLLGLDQLSNLFGLNLPSVTKAIEGSSIAKSSPGAFEAAKFGAQTIPFLFTGGATIPEQIAVNAGQGALTNAHHPGWGAIVGGGLGAFSGLVHKAADAVIGSFDNEVNAAFDRLGISNAPLGERMQNPGLYKFAQNVLTKAPFSGAAQNYMNINGKLNNAVSEALKTMNPSGPIDQIPENIQKTLKSVFADVTKQKNVNYDAVDQRAKEIGAYVNPVNYSQKAQSILNEANELSKTSPELGLSSTTKNFLQSIIDSASEPKTFKETSLVLGKLNNLADDLYHSNNFGSSYEAGLIRSLKPSMLQDMNEGATNAGDSELMNLHSKAQEYYANDYAPFLDKNIKQYLSGGSKADNPDLLIQSFLKTGANNQPTLLNKLMTKLPENQKGDVGYYFLNKSLPRDELGNPIMDRNTLIRLNKSLQNYSPQVRNQLIPENVQNTLKDVGLAQSFITNPMVNPQTGQRLTDFTGIGALGALGLGAWKDPDRRNEYLAAMAGITPGGRLAQMALTSPALRQFLQKGALTSATKLAPLIAAISNNLLNSNRSQP